MMSLIGFVIWDRRSALSPAIRKTKELEEREEKIEKALKKLAEKKSRSKRSPERSWYPLEIFIERHANNFLRRLNAFSQALKNMP